MYVDRKVAQRLAKRVARSNPGRSGTTYVSIRHIRYAPPKLCIFCGGSPLTGEHVWSDWLRNYLVRTKKSYHALQTIVHLDRTTGRLQKRANDPQQRKVRCVCKACNGGWMKALEDETKIILGAMLRQETERLYPAEQVTLAAWVALKAIVMEYDRGEQRISTHAERQRMRRRRLPPDRAWKIWVGLFDRQKAMGVWSATALPVQEKIKSSKPHALRMNSQSLVFVVGDVFFMLFRCPLRSVFDTFNFGEAQRKARQIWPRSPYSFTWPPPAISETEADQAAGMFMNYSLRTQRALINEEEHSIGIKGAR
jgi:hypothetical protein